MSKTKSNVIEINLDLAAGVFTNKTGAELVIAIVEYLLFQRNQIPFVFPTFRLLLSNLEKENETDEYAKYFVQRQRQQALDTFNTINNLKKNVFDEFGKNTVLTARILFGATALTPREAYVIKLPQMSNEYSETQSAQDELSIKQILMSFLTSQPLYKLFSTNMSPTNTFIDLEIEADDTYESTKFFRKDYIELPNKCKTVLIKINHTFSTGGNVLHCHNLKILNDMERIAIHENMKQNNLVTLWWEAKDVIKGFKETLIKGRSIW